MKYDILSHFSGEVIFSAEIECAPDALPSTKLGLAVRAAVESGARLDRANLVGASLVSANLDRASLVDARLDRANLVGANLVDARLDRANLVGANLVDARLDRASLVGANLVGARLDRANLVGANLVDARLDRASLVGASLVGASGVIDLGCPDGWHAHAWLRDGYLSIRVGCQELRLHEARDYWRGKADRREVLAAVEYAAAVAGIRGWATEAPKQIAAD